MHRHLGRVAAGRWRHGQITRELDRSLHPAKHPATALARTRSPRSARSAHPDFGRHRPLSESVTVAAGPMGKLLGTTGDERDR